MKTFLVTQQEVLITTYSVEAEDEEDAIEAVQSGDGEFVSKDAESMPEGEDEWVAIAEESSSPVCYLHGRECPRGSECPPHNFVIFKESKKYD